MLLIYLYFTFFRPVIQTFLKQWHCSKRKTTSPFHLNNWTNWSYTWINKTELWHVKALCLFIFFLLSPFFYLSAISKLSSVFLVVSTSYPHPVLFYRWNVWDKPGSNALLQNSRWQFESTQIIDNACLSQTSSLKLLRQTNNKSNLVAGQWLSKSKWRHLRRNCVWFDSCENRRLTQTRPSGAIHGLARRGERLSEPNENSRNQLDQMPNFAWA